MLILFARLLEVSWPPAFGNRLKGDMCSASRSLAKSRNGLLIRSGALTIAMFLLAAPLRAAARPPGPVGWTDEHEKPKVLVVTPQGCPLLISGVDDSLLTAHHFELSFYVLNIGARPITYFAVRYSAYRGQSALDSGDTATDKGAIGPGSLNLAPGQWEDGELGAVDSPDAIDRVELAVDFVETTDGTTWGPDLSKNGVRLSALRSGARTAQAYLKSTLEAKGSAGLVAAVSLEHLPLEPDENNEPSKKRDYWEWAYRLGRDTIHRRVKQAIEKGGAQAAVAILNAPIGPPAEASK